MAAHAAVRVSRRRSAWTRTWPAACPIPKGTVQPIDKYATDYKGVLTLLAAVAGTALGALALAVTPLPAMSFTFVPALDGATLAAATVRTMGE